MAVMPTEEGPRWVQEQIKQGVTTVVVTLPLPTKSGHDLPPRQRDAYLDEFDHFLAILGDRRWHLTQKVVCHECRPDNVQVVKLTYEYRSDD